jgi:hypothetical protein
MRRRSFLSVVATLALIPRWESALAAQTLPAVDGDTGLMAMLRLLPDEPLDELGVRYANYETQRASVGIEETGADIDPDRWNTAMRASLMYPSSMGAPMDPMWREGLGFDLRDVAQMAEVGPSDTTILVLSGQFDAPSLTAAWEAGGYTSVETSGMAWYTLGEDNVIFDPDIPLSTYHVGMLSHLALLDDTIIVGTAQRVDMERVLSLHEGEGRSFTAGSGAKVVAAAPEDLAVGWIVDGAALMQVGDPLTAMQNNLSVPADVQERLATQAAEMAEETPRMPPIALALVGVTAGALDADAGVSFPDAPRGHAVAVVVPRNDADVETVAETVTRRLTTQDVPVGNNPAGVPYTELFTDVVVETSSNGAVVVDLTPGSDVASTQLIRLLQHRQLSFLSWGA